MAAIVVARRRHHREHGAYGRRERILPHVLIYLECQKNTLSERYMYVFVSLHITSCVSVVRSPATDEHKLCLFGTTLICTTLGILRYVNVILLLCKSPTEFSTPIRAVLKLCSRANLPCLVNMAPKCRLLCDLCIIGYVNICIILCRHVNSTRTIQQSASFSATLRIC